MSVLELRVRNQGLTNDETLYFESFMSTYSHRSSTTNTKTESGLYSFIELFIYDYGFCNYTILYARQEYYHFQSAN